MNLQGEKNKLFNKKIELWDIFKKLLNEYNIYDEIIINEIIKVEDRLNEIYLKADKEEIWG